MMDLKRAIAILEANKLLSSRQTEYVEAVDLIMEEITKYKELEEQGLLLKLPCKLGSTVYYIDKKIYKEYYIEEMEVEDITFRDNEFYISLYNLTTKYFDFCITSDDIGKTVFLTKEEAEQELKRLECAE